MIATDTMLAARYCLDGRIAAGGVGDVWRGRDTALNRPVAVKMLKAEYAQHPEAVARFRVEARLAGSVSHPAVARVYDYCEADGSYPPYLVMELVDGPSLADVLAAGPLEPARCMDIAAQTAAGLAAAHAAGLIHRDVKPANLILSGTGQVKITDFGIAHAAGTAPLTRTGMLVGTPAYLAPERVAGASGTPAADLYALGVVAYECLAGFPPFRGDPLAVAAAHRDRPLPPLPAGIPAEAVALVAALTMKDPAARPGDAQEVACWAGHLRDTLAGQHPLAEFSPAERSLVMPSRAEPRAGEPGGAGPLPVQPGLWERGGAGPVAEHLLPGEPEHYEPVAGVIARPGHTGRGWSWPVWSVAVPMIAAALLAGLAGWVLAGVVGATHTSAGRAASSVPSSSPDSRHPARVPAPGHRQAGRGSDSVVRQPAAGPERPRQPHMYSQQPRKDLPGGHWDHGRPPPRHSPTGRHHGRLPGHSPPGRHA
ncbi:MAG: serine/threonine protein kinase, partial [Actinobacteria bacterium]|nr:serine/threonine protein kinase [Actinomycetota bacterium]